MGFNISGLIINKNYKDKLTDLEAVLEEQLVFEKEVTFEEGSENWKEDTYCDVYYSEKGTLVFLAMEKAGFEFYAKNQNTFSFVLSEMTMTFGINYVEKGILARSIAEAESELLQNKGDLLEFEETETDKSELIYHLFDNTLGESFYDIDLEATCYRYSFETPEANTTTPENKPEPKKKKSWWQFW